MAEELAKIFYDKLCIWMNIEMHVSMSVNTLSYDANVSVRVQLT